MTEPTAAAVMDALPLVGGRISVALDEIIRLIETYLPEAVATLNERENLTINLPRSVRLAPSELDDVDIDSILIDFDVELNNQGAGSFAGIATVMIHSIDERLVHGRHINNVQDRGDLIMAILWYALGGWTNPAGQKAWSELAPLRKSQLPSEWRAYAGTTLTYRLVQYNDVWP